MEHQLGALSSLLMAGDTRATCSLLFIQLYGLKCSQFGAGALTPAVIPPLGSVLLSLLRHCLGAVGFSFPIRSQEASNVLLVLCQDPPWRLGTSSSSSHPRGPVGDMRSVSPLSSCPPVSDGVAGHCSTCLWCQGCPL